MQRSRFVGSAIDGQVETPWILEAPAGHRRRAARPGSGHLGADAKAG